MAVTQAEKGARFRALHEGQPFLIPNPWDAGGARVMEALGFEALATTSSGLAFTLGRLDGEASLDEVIAHVELLASVTEVPLAVDLEDGHGPQAEDAARAIERAAAAGAVGGSIEDFDRIGGRLYGVEEAADRVAAAVAAAAALDFPFVLTARAENHIRGNPDLDDTIVRLRAYEAAGAEVLYAPGLGDADEVRAVCEAVGRPLNVLAHRGLSVAEVFAAGAQRISVGGALAWVAVEAMADAAIAMRDQGDLSSLAGASRIRAWLR
ncbi:MAG TPA: isocitrate lyase/phosphoenolpyruvate mutase family protein [Solirubrobacterales bacterium]|nr:isocitrate lyase/phosphoenolpyruvate mutase family protein [Solirubrobacterales bacterium]